MKLILFLSCCLFLLSPFGTKAQDNVGQFEFSLKMAHPTARALMKEDFYWSPIDESGPFGSDAGSDAAYGFHKWRRTHINTSPILYLKQMIDSWNFPPFAWDELDTNKIKMYVTIPAHVDEAFITRQIEMLKEENARYTSTQGGGKKLSDEQLRQIAIAAQKNMGASYLSSIDEAIIGTAFAQFVLEGKIDPTLKIYVTKTVQREMLPFLTRQLGKPDQVQAYNDKMKKLLQVIKKMPS